ncbi:MAG: RNA polymerase-binding protein DksA [Alphaproteobacteria bacterium]
MSEEIQKIDEAIAKSLLPPDYKPTKKEDFMSSMQLEYFRQKLLYWKKELICETTDTLEHLRQDSLSSPDVNDRASLETEHAFELRTRDRYRKLIAKIDEALHAIDIGEYGYCEITGNPIPLERLEARPIATMTIEAQENYERGERTRKDDRE